MAESYVGVKCHRSGKSVYAADKPITIDLPGGEKWTFLRPNFTCAKTGVLLTLKTYAAYEGEVYLKTGDYISGKQPEAGAAGCADVVTARVLNVPDSNMRTTDRMFNVAGKQAVKACTTEDACSTYGANAIDVERQMAVPDANMRTGDRVFQIAANQKARGTTQATEVKSAFGAGAVNIEDRVNAVKRPDTVQNVNMMEKRHNGVNKYRGVEGQEE